MSKSVVKVHPITDILNMPLFAKVEESLDAIRKRAHELFATRGYSHGRDLEDWLAAEQDLFLQPEADLSETETQFELTAEVPGFDPKTLKVTVEPTAVSILAESEETGETGFRSRELFRHYRLNQEIRPEAVTASYDDGKLTVVLPKMRTGTPEAPREEEPAKKTIEIPVKAAAA